MRVVWVHAHRDAGGVTVTGLVRRVTSRPGPVPGYIRLILSGTDGSPAATRCLVSRDLQAAGTRGGTFIVHVSGAFSRELLDARYAAACKETGPEPERRS